MLKIFFLSSFVIITLVCCSNSVEPFDFERDTPQWLKLKIDSIDVNPNNAGTTVYRYDWRSDFVYHISIPISSCMFCLVYDQEGNKIEFTDEAIINDFHNNRTNEIIIWQKGFN